MKNQKGITLIALIITIIVMLILVGVSVTVALNGGLFTTAQKAKGDTETEKQKELALSDGRIKVGDTWYDSLEDYKDGIVSSNQGETSGENNGDGTGNGGTTEEPESGVTLTWTHEDVNSNNTFDVGEVVTASNGESFYVIAPPDDNTIKLLAAKCVNTSTWKQDDNYNYVAFDEGDDNGFKPGSTTTYATNVYANASIKGLVEIYVTEILGLSAEKGMLMSMDEADTLVGTRTYRYYIW